MNLQTAAACKRAEELEASMSWLHTEFVTLNTEVAIICEDAVLSFRTPTSAVSTPVGGR